MYFGTLQKQKGVTLSGLLVWSAILVMVAMLGMKLVPAYLEYTAIERTLTTIANDQSMKNASPSIIRQSFNKNASINDINVIRGKDINMSKVKGELILESDYSVTVPLFANFSLLINFNASSQ